MSLTLVKRVLALAALAVLASGCVSVPPGGGFDDVQRSASDRTGGLRVRWNRLTPDDAAVAAAVRALLASGLDADRAAAVALLNNRRLQAIFENLGVAQADVVRAGLLRNPVFDADLKFDTAGGGTNVELALVQDLVDVFTIPLRKRVAADRFEAAKLRVTGAVVDLAGRARAAFYDYQADARAADLRRTAAAASAASYEFARRLHDAGNVSDLDLANEQVAHEQAKLDLAAGEAAVLDARERLNALLGLWGPDAAWAAPASLPDPPAADPPIDDVERRAIEQSLDLASGRIAVEMSARSLGIAKSFGLLPEAALGAAAEREAAGGWGVGPAFSLPIPLFDGGQATAASARAGLERACMDFYATAVEVRSAARAARNRLLAARAAADHYARVVLPLRHKITEETQLRYNGMFVGAFQLLQAKQAEVAAGIAATEAVRDYWLARTQLEQVLAGRTAPADGATGVARALADVTRSADH